MVETAVKLNSLLHGAEVYPDDELALGGDALQHVGLETPQHMGSQKVMQLLDLVLLGDVLKLIQEDLQIPGGKSVSFRA